MSKRILIEKRYEVKISRTVWEKRRGAVMCPSTLTEYPIPLADAQIMLETLCDRPLISKTRYRIEYQGLIWEVDEFQGDNSGLIIAEVELTTENQLIELPDWVGVEVSWDPIYYNANLVKYPYSQWEK